MRKFPGNQIDIRFYIQLQSLATFEDILRGTSFFYDVPPGRQCNGSLCRCYLGCMKMLRNPFAS